MASFSENPGKPVPEYQAIFNFSAAQYDDDKQNSRTCKTQSNHPTPTYQHSSLFTGQMSFLLPNQQCQRCQTTNNIRDKT